MIRHFAMTMDESTRLNSAMGVKGVGELNDRRHPPYYRDRCGRARRLSRAQARNAGLERVWRALREGGSAVA